MRQILLHHLYSGQLFFSASLLFVITAAVALTGVLRSRPRLKRVNGFLGVLAIPLAGLSGTPVPLLLAIPLLAAALVFVVLPEREEARVLPRSLGVAAVVLALIAIAIELPFQLRRPEVSRPSALVVIGDSLSSGGFGEDRVWPATVAASIGARLENLALPSDTAAAAVKNQLPLLVEQKSGATTIVEIGGNEMIGGGSPAEYEAALRDLVTAAKRQGPAVLIVELPQIPGTFRFGAAQRRVARESRSVLVPKRLLASVLSDPRNTSDGIHLTQRGHDQLALELLRWLRW
jgi:lysophospholipase L1-like esterase